MPNRSSFTVREETDTVCSVTDTSQPFPPFHSSDGRLKSQLFPPTVPAPQNLTFRASAPAQPSPIFVTKKLRQTPETQSWKGAPEF
eukprot:6174061-Pleurochrysis_carterae.AAC.1